MKRGAVAIAFAAIALLTALWAWGAYMGGCDIRYQLITPDGWALDFAGPRFAPGTADSLMAHEGFGLPPVEHVTEDIYGMPGALMQDTLVKARVVTITTTTHGLTRSQLHRARAKLNEAMRWDRGTKAQPSILRYWVNGTARDLYVHYAGDVTRSVGRYGQVEIIGFRLVAYDPFFYDAAVQEQVLDWQHDSTVRYFATRVNGVWEQDITQPAVVGAGASGTSVRCFAIHPSTGDIYIGGEFTNWNGNGLSAYLVRWMAATDTWQNVGTDGIGGPALNEGVFDLLFDPDGYTLYVAGMFTNAGGVPTADYAAQVDVRTDTWADIGGGPGGAAAVTLVRSLIIDQDGWLYLAGWFTNWQGEPNIVAWDGVAWQSLAGGANQLIWDLALLPNGDLAAVGGATVFGGVNSKYFAIWDGTTWISTNTDADANVLSVVAAPDGGLYLGGSFTLIGGVSATRIAYYNGSAFTQLGTGADASVRQLGMDSQGNLYAGGMFTTMGGVTLTDRLAVWNGSSWSRLDLDLPGANEITAIRIFDDNLYIGGEDAGTAYFSQHNTVINEGNAYTFPMIEIKNQGLLRNIYNETTGDHLIFDLAMLDGEILTINLASGYKTIESSFWGNRLGDLFPNSDLGKFCLESSPRAAYGGIEGANLITVFITDADPREAGDNNNQLDDWENITGIAQGNTDYGKIYVTIVDEGAGANYHVDLYQDAARTEQIGHTGSYPNLFAGPMAIVEDNDSGLGGSITLTATVAADADIEVTYTIVTMFWRNRWWDVDSAVS